MSTQKCFCGCDIEVLSATQLAGNLLGHNVTGELGEWMKVVAFFDAVLPGRDQEKENAIVGDGRTLWLSLRSQVHDNRTQSRADRRATKRWLRRSAKERRKLGRALDQGGWVVPFHLVVAAPDDVRLWLSEGEKAAWMQEITDAFHVSRPSE